VKPHLYEGQGRIGLDLRNGLDGTSAANTKPYFNDDNDNNLQMLQKYSYPPAAVSSARIHQMRLQIRC
jgi:hypothetical protein